VIWLAVAFGGALGALARFGLTLLLPPVAGKFPWPTFWANALGCFLMGVFFYCIVVKAIWPPSWRPFLMVGFLGALTTFSSYAQEVLSLWQGQFYSTAVLYLLSSWAINLLAVVLGYSWVKSFF
jgi:CrcB protein